MANILILGAGSIGTAFSFPCSDNKHSVSIVGTHLENNFIDQINSKNKHPALNCYVPKGAQKTLAITSSSYAGGVWRVVNPCARISRRAIHLHNILSRSEISRHIGILP